ncbi:MAG: oxidoreductase [marine bacterium B5-7]|nr:MAG: oxidoreductase [marine bacterium B5-7]
MSKAFASKGDLEPKKVTFSQLSKSAYAYTAEGDPNTGVIVGENSVMVVDAQATPAMARDVIEKIRSVTDKPIRYVTLSHYHAVRVLGASAYENSEIIASQDTYDLIVERGEQDYQSEFERFPRLFQDVESIPGLTWPSIVFNDQMTLWMGNTEVRILQLGRGHTKGDTVVWLPDERVLFSGDLVEYGATPYTGDAYLKDWPATLDNIAAMDPAALVPGRGEALTTTETVRDGIQGTRDFISRMYQSVKAGRDAGMDLQDVYKATYDALKPDFGHWVIFDHCLPFDVSRAYDESGGVSDPQIWTAERDANMWQALEDAQS